MQATTFSKICINAHEFLEYVPVVSTIVGVITLIAKAILGSAEDQYTNKTYANHLRCKPYSHIWYPMIPFAKLFRLFFQCVYLCTHRAERAEISSGTPLFPGDTDEDIVANQVMKEPEYYWEHFHRDDEEKRWPKVVFAYLHGLLRFGATSDDLNYIPESFLKETLGRPELSTAQQNVALIFTYIDKIRLTNGWLDHVLPEHVSSFVKRQWRDNLASVEAKIHSIYVEIGLSGVTIHETLRQAHRSIRPPSGKASALRGIRGVRTAEMRG